MTSAVPSAAAAGEVVRIGGWSRLSTCDWPGRLVTTVFCQGCPWRCGYCHNPGLLPARGPAAVSWVEVLAHLVRRTGLLDGIVFSGGEPLLQRGLAQAVREARALGFRVGLHTGGAFPRRLARLLDADLLDWVGFDVKAPPGRYERVTGTGHAAASAERSLRLLLASGVPHQLRTTVDPSVLDPPAMADLDDWLAGLGAGATLRQTMRPPAA
ncbi:anaerobic ribonucleoside-triphosphate reductase activating protein [Streptomyces sp. NBC_00435]|uniref:anaerobic ribonucleoside-triphosphate reductase activating protein n=1 Tax=Streptomyces sp. NBC_00435 TaxID=2903649 RepID=UPI002E2447B6